MGVNLAPLISEYKEKTDFPRLRGWVIVIDGFNTLYQFLTTIRDKTGRPLRDSSGRVTSHLSGLFYRNVNLLKFGIKPAYVFDGPPPRLKMLELERRNKIKAESRQKFEEALARKDFEAARKYAAMAAQLEEYMVVDAKELLRLMGIPVIDAPQEGEAQAAYIAMKGDADAVGSQDYDSLLFGAPKVVRNITLTGTVKYPSKGIEVKMEPEIIRLDRVLEKLGITRQQLVDVAILIGTDYNDGVKGIGPKKAYDLVRRYGSIEHIPEVWGKLDMDLVREIRKIFLSPEVTDEYDLTFSTPDYEGIMRFLCDEHDFSRERVKKALDELRRALSVKSLDQWF